MNNMAWMNKSKTELTNWDKNRLENHDKSHKYAIESLKNINKTIKELKKNPKKKISRETTNSDVFSSNV